jgi:hypothetical protein
MVSPQVKRQAVFSHVPNGKIADVARMLKAIHIQPATAFRRR